jgi:hypothetical protein
MGLFAFTVFGLAGCGGGGGGDSDNTPVATTSQTSSGSSTNTGNNAGGGNTNQPTSTASITSYMSTAHQAESTSYATDLTPLRQQIALMGRSYSTYELEQVLALKLSHIQNFINVSLQYATITKSTFTLDKPAIKSLFMSYQTTDKADMTNTLSSVRTGTATNNVISDGIILIDSYYGEALLKIDAM